MAGYKLTDDKVDRAFAMVGGGVGIYLAKTKLSPGGHKPAPPRTWDMVRQVHQPETGHGDA